jgi:hypothetical protein
MGVVDFAKARGLVKFQSPLALAGPWALKHYNSLGVCKIYYSHFILEVMYHSSEKTPHKSPGPVRVKALYYLRSLKSSLSFVSSAKMIRRT